MLQLSCLSGLDDVVTDCVADDGAPCPCLLHSALCCPTDPLVGDDGTVIIQIIDDDDDELLKDLAVAASLPPGHVLFPPTDGRHRNENNVVKSGSAAAGQTTTGHGCRGVSSAAGDVPRLPPAVHAALLDKGSSSSSWTTTTSSLAAAAVSRTVDVPSRKRARSVVSGTRSWSSLDMPSGGPTPRRHDPNDDDNRRAGKPQQGLLAVSRRRRPRNDGMRDHRACSRCNDTETPHWRAGPDGPGTLCNACGIRFMRVHAAAAGQPPEYHRPSASHGTKVVEQLREKKANMIR